MNIKREPLSPPQKKMELSHLDINPFQQYTYMYVSQDLPPLMWKGLHIKKELMKCGDLTAVLDELHRGMGVSTLDINLF